MTYFGFSFGSCCFFTKLYGGCCQHSLSGKCKSVAVLHALILHEPLRRPFLPHSNQRVCVSVFVVSIVLVMGVRKESPASSFPLVAWSDDDVTVGGLEVHGTMGNDLT